MKFTIDTINKVVELEGSATIEELMKQFVQLFPTKEWTEIIIKSKEVTNNVYHYPTLGPNPINDEYGDWIPFNFKTISNDLS